MTRERWVSIALKVFVAGGVAWLLKLVSIPTTGGEDFESPVVAFFFFAGMLGMLLGSTGLGGRLALTTPLAVYVLALVLSPIVIWFVFMVFDEGLKPIGELGPRWYEAEAGITLMAVVMIVVGLLLLRKRTEPRSSRPPLAE